MISVLPLEPAPIVGGSQPERRAPESENDSAGVPRMGTSLKYTMVLPAVPTSRPESRRSVLDFRYQSGFGPSQVL